MNEAIQRLLKDLYVLMLTCSQWGDTGKGKFVDLFADWADVIVRGTGGANAGHTICIDGETYIFHLTPSGILHAEKINILGSGMAIDPNVLVGELDTLDRLNKPYANLHISLNAKLTLTPHILMDLVRESKSDKIGTTGRGITPTYLDHYARVGMTIQDLLNPDHFKTKFVKMIEEKVVILKSFDPEFVKTLMHGERLGSGAFYKATGFFDHDAIIEHYMSIGKRLHDYIDDTDTLINTLLANDKRILGEGAQGTWLSIDHGSYPYLTSSDCTVGGLLKGSGFALNGSMPDMLAISILKAYVTRVGRGAFPTEYGGTASADWCETTTRDIELVQFAKVSVNDDDDFNRGVALRIKGQEYGSTTGRPRRDGRLDLSLLRYSRNISGRYIGITKVDVLDECEYIEVCTHYTYQGPKVDRGRSSIVPGQRIDIAFPHDDILKHCQPHYEILEGWMTDTTKITDKADLPKQLLDYIRFIERESDTEAVFVSVGPDRNQTIFLN
jgi:adenylosuccinate synthase